MRQPMPRCLVNGQHTPGSEWERECPLNPNRAVDQIADRERRHQAASPAQRAAWAAGAQRLAERRQEQGSAVFPSGTPAGNTQTAPPSVDQGRRAR